MCWPICIGSINEEATLNTPDKALIIYVNYVTVWPAYIVSNFNYRIDAWRCSDYAWEYVNSADVAVGTGIRDVVVLFQRNFAYEWTERRSFENWRTYTGNKARRIRINIVRRYHSLRSNSIFLLTGTASHSNCCARYICFSFLNLHNSICIFYLNRTHVRGVNYENRCLKSGGERTNIC